jgi:hypothetical protein
MIDHLSIGLPAGATMAPRAPCSDDQPDYYAAFIIDPDGYRIEAVCHRPQP